MDITFYIRRRKAGRVILNLSCGFHQLILKIWTYPKLEMSCLNRIIEAK
jgi:hypothetical protein